MEEMNKEKEVSRMQNNLSALRKMAGWTTEQLAKKLDVSKQTICNLENKENHTKMKYAQYIALKAIFEEEIENNKENELLKKAYDMLINNPDPDEMEYQKAELVVDTLAISRTSGKKDIDLIKIMAIMAGIAVPIVGAVLAKGVLGQCFDKIFENNRK